jgi:hypothetical protein
MKQEFSLSAYLKGLRKTRGYACIKDYLSVYSLPISEAYYRDLESGRNKVALDTAGALCLALRANSREFYLNLLYDVLPAGLAGLLIAAEPKTTELTGHYRLNCSMDPNKLRVIQSEIEAVISSFQDCSYEGSSGGSHDNLESLSVTVAITSDHA